MKALMSALRENPPADFDGVKVRQIRDYLTGSILEDGKTSPTGLPSSNVLYYRLENNDVIVARPSGTEPKIKFYYLLQATDASAAKAKLSRYNETLNRLL